MTVVPAAIGCGERMRSIEPLRKSSPTAMMNTATTSPATYSSRPCPKGCSSSAGLAASLKPSSATTEEPASERLLTASAMMAILPEINPTVNFAAKSPTLQTMPTVPASSP